MYFLLHNDHKTQQVRNLSPAALYFFSPFYFCYYKIVGCRHACLFPHCGLILSAVLTELVQTGSLSLHPWCRSGPRRQVAPSAGRSAGVSAAATRRTAWSPSQTSCRRVEMKRRRAPSRSTLAAGQSDNALHRLCVRARACVPSLKHHTPSLICLHVSSLKHISDTRSPSYDDDNDSSDAFILIIISIINDIYINI